MGSLTWRICVSLLFLPSVHALESIDLQLDSIEKAGVSIQGIALQIRETDNQLPGLSLELDKIKLPGFDKDISAQLSCINSDFQSKPLSCNDGNVVIRVPGVKALAGNFRFKLDLPGMTGEFSLVLDTPWGTLSADYHSGGRQAWQGGVQVKEFDLGALANFITPGLSTVPTHQLLAGRLNAKADIKGSAFQLNEMSLQASLLGLSVEGDSIIDKASLVIDGELQRVEQGWQFRQNLKVDAGEMYLQPGVKLLGDEPGFYIDASASVIAFNIQGNWSSAQRLLQVQSFEFIHPGILELGGNTRLVLDGEVSLASLYIVSKIADLGLTYPVYIQPLLLQTNFSDMEVAGAVGLALDYQDNVLHSMNLEITGVYIDDASERFSISNLNSQLNLSKENTLMQSELGWEGLSFYRLDLGPGDILFESNGNDVRVLAWENVSILDGALIIDEFNLKNIASQDFSLSIGGRLQPISMEMLTHAMGWTVFAGELSGEISGLKYHRNRLELEGDIQFSLFDGKLNIRDLQVDDIFSSYSVMTTDISIEKLDLEQMTDVFAFGKIEGSLSGSINKLKMEDWRPSYFEAEFATPLDDDAPHRISQKALENLNELGGGLSGTLSRGFLRFLPSYSYGRLGISCRLVNGVCELGGVEDHGEGFAILTKGGLFPPWVEVKGAGRAIKWDDLIDGLKQISEGEVAIQ